MNILRWVIRVLAVWRITELVTADEISREPREWVERHTSGKIAYLVSCKRCVSVWAGLVVVWLPKRWINALAASAVTVLIGETIDARQAAAADRKMARVLSGAVHSG